MTSTRTPHTDRLDLYDLAFLAGGPARVVDAAVVALLESGRVGVRDTGELYARDASRRHPVEAAVLDAVGSRGRHSVGTVRWRVRDDQRITKIGDRLSTTGLVRRPLLARYRAPAWARTAAGRRSLRELRQCPPTDLVAPGTSALSVALHGPAAMTDPVVRARVFDPPTAAPADPQAHWGSVDARVAGPPYAVWGIGLAAGGWGGDGGGAGLGGDGGCGGDGGGGC
jgi:hypothetical protein